MNVHTHSLPDSQAELHITADWDEVREDFDKMVSEFQGVQLPGFRHGRKLKRAFVMRRFNKELLFETARQFFETKQEAIAQEQNLKMIGQAAIEVIKGVEDEALEFKVRAEVMPSVATVDFKGLEVFKDDAEIPEDAVDKTLHELQHRHATAVPVETGAAENHHVVGNFVLVGRKAKSQPFRFQLLPDHAWTQPLTGAKAGDVIELPALNEGDPNREVTVEKVEDHELPELNDEFASVVDAKLETLDELKSRIRESIEHRMHHDKENRRRDQLRKALIDKNSLVLPRMFVLNYAYQIAKDYFGDVSGTRGTSMVQAMVPTAELDIHFRILAEKLLEQEGLTPTDEQVEEHLKGIDKENGMSEDQLAARFYNEQEMTGGRNHLETERVYRLLEDNAIEKDPPPPEEKSEQETEPEAPSEGPATDTSAETETYES